MTVKRFTLCAAAAAALSLSSFSAARADISFGDLSDALDDFGADWIEQVLDGICAWLLMPVTVPPIDVALPPAPLLVGEHPDLLPTTVDASIDAADELSADLQARVDAAEAVVTAATEAQATQSSELQVLQAMNMDPPVSVSAAAQIGNQVALVSARAAANSAQLQAAQVTLQAAQVAEAAHAKQVAVQQHAAWAGPASGGTVRAGGFRMPWR